MGEQDLYLEQFEVLVFLGEVLVKLVQNVQLETVLATCHHCFQWQGPLSHPSEQLLCQTGTNLGDQTL